MILFSDRVFPPFHFLTVFMAKVLVTGASGFIGENLAEVLIQRGDEVTCLVRKTSPRDALSKLGVQFCVGDITDLTSLATAVARADVVYHVAGLTKANTLADLNRVNESGVRNVAEAC